MIRYICIFTLISLSIFYQAFGEPIIITSKKTQIRNPLSSIMLKNIFLGKYNNYSIILIKNKDVHNTFVRTYIGRTTQQYESLWRKKLFTGKSSLPKDFSNYKEVVEYLKQHPNTIGYIDSSYKVDNDIMILKVK